MFCCFASITPRRGLVVNEIEVRVIMNIHLEQPLELNLWKQASTMLRIKCLGSNPKDAGSSPALGTLPVSKAFELS